MICTVSGRIVIGDIDEKIRNWQVWFRTPLGISKSLSEAVKVLEEHKLDPTISVVPICVAISDSTYEEWHR